MLTAPNVRLTFHTDGRIEVAGDPSALAAFSDLVRHAGSWSLHGGMGGKDETTVNVVVALSDGFVCISRSANELRIAGTVERLAILADNVRHVASSTPPAHAHIDYHPGHPYLDPACAWLIVSNEDQPGNRVLRSGRWRYGGTVQGYVWIICQNHDFYYEEFDGDPPDVNAEGGSYYVLYGLEPDVTRHSSRSITCLSWHEAVVVAEQTLQQLTWDPPP